MLLVNCFLGTALVVWVVGGLGYLWGYSSGWAEQIDRFDPEADYKRGYQDGISEVNRALLDAQKPHLYVGPAPEEADSDSGKPEHDLGGESQCQ